MRKIHKCTEQENFIIRPRKNGESVNDYENYYWNQKDQLKEKIKEMNEGIDVFDIERVSSHGPAILEVITHNNSAFAHNGEYIAEIKYCPFCGKDLCES